MFALLVRGASGWYMLDTFANTIYLDSSCKSGASSDASSGNGGMGAVVAGVSLAGGAWGDTGVGTSPQSSLVVGAL